MTCTSAPPGVRTRGVAGVKSPLGHEYQTRQPSPLCSGAPAVTHTALAIAASIYEAADVAQALQRYLWPLAFPGFGGLRAA